MTEAMKSRFTILILIVSGISGLSQISPGDLARSHADLEGMFNCTKCHTLGDKVSNNKCLDCHSEIKERLENNRGYHAAEEVRNQDCFECHSDHHGRNFDMIRFDENEFDHNLTGYKLEGAHDKIDCRSCHIEDNIVELKLKDRENTFLGLSQRCIACHLDYHQKTLTEDCLNCHNFEAFRPAPYFDHDQANFTLRGKHIEIDCKACHPVEINEDREFQVFKGIQYNACTACHIDPHENNLGKQCTDCHIESGFENFVGQKRFNHNLTEFELIGKHTAVDCFGCHLADLPAAELFQKEKGIKKENCIACHTDEHEGKFGINCIQCHNENSFKITGSLTDFDHSLTDFELLGKHEFVDCKSCHNVKYTDPLRHEACLDCHVDYHEGQLMVNNQILDCRNCHIEESFSPSLFTIEKHNELEFKLTGAHLATPCFECHLEEEKWNFNIINQNCVNCHLDPHLGLISDKYYPYQKCDQCHKTDAWNIVYFDHSLTNWELEGTHARIDCRSCHYSENETSGELIQQFSNLEPQCTQCHMDIHQGQFKKDGITNCSACHGFESWDPSYFNHDETAFKLDGEHSKLSCDACHKATEISEQLIVQYKIESFDCIDCHQ